VNVTGEATVVVDKVVAAVNAFKDATGKSIAAANAVKTAAQSKNFSAIMDAKKKVQSAVEAVKQAKADVTTAIDALKTAGPEAEAAVKAMGIDISMFAGKDGDATSNKTKKPKVRPAGDGDIHKDYSQNNVHRDYFPPKDAGKGDVRFGYEYRNYKYIFGKASFQDFSLVTRYSVLSGVEASVKLFLPAQRTVVLNDTYVGTVRFVPENYTGLYGPTIGVRYWLPIGLGFFYNVELPIDTREGSDITVAMYHYTGSQYSVNLTEKLSLGSQIGLTVPFVNSETKRANGIDMCIGVELDYSFGAVTPFLGVDMLMGLTRPTVDGKDVQGSEARPVGYNLLAGSSIALNSMFGADAYLEYRLGERYEDSKPIVIGAHLFFNF
jgi:hypothetical protein